MTKEGLANYKGDNLMKMNKRVFGTAIWHSDRRSLGSGTALAQPNY